MKLNGKDVAVKIASIANLILAINVVFGLMAVVIAVTVMDVEAMFYAVFIGIFLILVGVVMRALLYGFAVLVKNSENW